MNTYLSYDFFLETGDLKAPTKRINLAKGKKTTTKESEIVNRTPFAGAVPSIEKGVGLANQAVDDISRTPFPGPFTAPVQPAEQLSNVFAQDFALQNIGQVGTQTAALTPILAEQLANQTGFFKLPQISDLNPEDFQAAISAAGAPLLRQVQEQLIPQLQSQAIAQGAFSNNRATTIQPEQVARDTSREIADIASQTLLADLAQQRQAIPQLAQQAIQGFQTVPGLERDAFSLGQTPINALGLAGQQGRALEQVGINENLAQFQEGLAAPTRGIGDFANTINALTGQFGVQSSEGTSTTSQSGGLLSGIVGALSGAAGLLGSGGLSGLTGAGAGKGGSGGLIPGVSAGTPGFQSFNPGPLQVPKIGFG